MSGEPIPERMVCANCGFINTGNFCSNCGSQLKPSADTLFGLIDRDVLNVKSGFGILSVLGRLARAPVRTTLEFANDPAFVGHWPFFIVATAVSLFAQGLLQRAQQKADAPARATEAGPDPDIWQRYTESLSQSGEFRTAIAYVFFLTAVVLGYFVFSRLAATRRSPRAYLKLSCLATGFAQFLYAGLAALWFAGLRVPSAAIFFLLVNIALFLFLTRYQFRVQRQFWVLSFRRTLAGYLLVFLAAFPVGGAITLLVAFGFIGFNMLFYPLAE